MRRTKQMHKRLAIIVLLAILPGCALVEKVDRIVRPPQFDSAEYGTLVDVRQMLERTYMCDNPADQLSLALGLQIRIDWVHKYSEYLPRNKESYAMLTAFKEEADMFVAHASERANPTYCQLKLEHMSEQAIIIQRALGDK